MSENVEFKKKLLTIADQDREFFVSRLEGCIEKGEDVLTLVSRSKEWKDDLDIFMMAVRVNGDAIAYASDRLKKNRELVLEAVKRSGSALSYVGKDFLLDREIVAEAVKSGANSWALKHFSDDKELALEAVKNGSSLQYVSVGLRDDMDIMMAAITVQGGWTLSYASDRLRGNVGLVLLAAKEMLGSTEHAAPWIREACQGKDKIVVLKSLVEYEENRLKEKAGLESVLETEGKKARDCRKLKV